MPKQETRTYKATIRIIIISFHFRKSNAEPKFWFIKMSFSQKIRIRRKKICCRHKNYFQGPSWRIFKKPILGIRTKTKDLRVWEKIASSGFDFNTQMNVSFEPTHDFVREEARLNWLSSFINDSSIITRWDEGFEPTTLIPPRPPRPRDLHWGWFF